MAFLQTHRINLLEGGAGSLNLEGTSQTGRRHKQVENESGGANFCLWAQTAESDVSDYNIHTDLICHLFFFVCLFLKMTWGQVRMSFIPLKASKHDPFFPLIIYGLICTYPWTFDLQEKSSRSTINPAEQAPNNTNCVLSVPIICILS